MSVLVDSWRDFPDAVTSRIGELNSADFVFRGQPNNSFLLESSFDRLFRHLLPQKRLAAQRRIEGLFQLTAEKAEVQLPSEEFDRWAFGQHFGLATRMLDWTESRYIAAFFAFSALRHRYPSSLAAEQDDSGSRVSIFALDGRSPLWSNDSVEIHRVQSPTLNDRIRKQRGLFTMNRTLFISIEEFLGDYVARNPDDLDHTPIYRFDLPVSCARQALRDLQEMRISDSELFPGFDGVAREAMLLEWSNAPVS